MATKRKQQTVQFLFKASSENDITRCVISTSSDTIENDEENNCFKKLSSLKNGWKQNKESDNDHQNDCDMKKEGGFDQETIFVNNRTKLNKSRSSNNFYSQEIVFENLRCEFEDSNSKKSDNDSTIILNAKHGSEVNEDGTVVENKVENKDVHGVNEMTISGLGDLHNINKGRKPQVLGIKLNQCTVSNNTCQKSYNDFHNTVQQGTQSNPRNNSSQKQFPAAGDLNYFKARRKSVNFSAGVDCEDSKMKCEVSDDLNTVKYDDNESKYLHLIGCDLSEHISAVDNFSHLETGHQIPYLSKRNANNGKKTLFEVNNNLNTLNQENYSNYVHDYDRQRQLRDLDNPQRLQEKQTKHYNPNSCTDTDIFHQLNPDFNTEIQTESKVKSLILNFELQVQEIDSRHKLEEKRDEQGRNISTLDSKSIDLRPNKSITHRRTEESQTGYNSPFNKWEQSQIYDKTNNNSPRLHHKESESEDFINITATKSISFDNFHFPRKDNSANCITDSKAGKQSTILGNTHQPLPSQLGSKNQFANRTTDSQLTRAHWYDINSPLQQPSREIELSSSERNTFTPPSTVKYHTERERGFNRMQRKRWKSLGELDKMEEAEEYKLPDKLSKTPTPLVNQEGVSPKNYNLDTIYFDAQTANNVPFHTQRITSDINSFELVSSDSKTAQPCSSIARKKHEHTNNTRKLGSGFDSKRLKPLLPSTKLAKESSLQAREQERLTRHFRQVQNSPDSSLFQKKTRDFDDSFNSSLTVLKTQDQSPMKRSQKMKDLVNIEYYDINSDEELNSKIKRRPRTRSLNEENKLVEYLLPKREFKSSGDLRSVGLTRQEMNDHSITTERARSFDLISDSLSQEERTHGKYAELYAAKSTAFNSSSQGFDEPNSGTRVRFQEESLNAFDSQPKDSQIPTYTTVDITLSNEENFNVTEHQYERTLFSGKSKLTSHKKLRNHRHTDNLESDMKRLANPQRISTGKSDNTTKQYENHVEDISQRFIKYPIRDFQANQGIYNIARAEEDWKRKYGKLRYNKIPLHQASDKEFGRLFQHVERKSTIRSNSNESDLNTNSISQNGAIANTSSSGLFSLNGNKSKDEKESSSKSQSQEFVTTLSQLSSYVLSGYKGDLRPTYPFLNQDKTEICVEKRRYYLDDEGDLAHILDDSDEFPKLSMLVHAVIRLREVYKIGECTKPHKEHPTNLGNPQLRDAIQNKPMNVLKDLIVSDKGMNVNVRSQAGNSALHRAAMEGDIGVIRVLIEHGADVNIRDRHGFQPVHSALRHHYYKAAMFLMDCGTDLMSYTSKRIQQFVSVKAISKQYLRQTLKTPM